MSDLRFSTHYSIYGARLNVDDLLARAKPRSAYRLWRRGEPNAGGNKAVTSGVQVHLWEGTSVGALHRAVVRFLEREHRFLSVAGKMTGPKVISTFSTALFVHAIQPVTLSLPPGVMARLVRSGVGWSATGYPCSD